MPSPPLKLRLFLYGTLQPQAGTRIAGWLAARLESAEAASIPGRLHAIRGGTGWFPALVPAKGDGRVRGALCELRLRPGERALLDRYEGREYRRVTVCARTASGRRVAAQVYLWRVDLPPATPAISGGDFLEWLREGRRNAYSTARHGI